jgi:hypothetical protein
MTKKILTANDLLSGGVVYLTTQGAWSSFISQAHLSGDNDTEQKLSDLGKEAVEQQVIVEPFFIDITEREGQPVPVRYREFLRVNGPSVRADFSKPSFKEVA